MYVVFVTFCLKENTIVLFIFLSNSVESGEISSHVVLYEWGGAGRGEGGGGDVSHTLTHTHTYYLVQC